MLSALVLTQALFGAGNTKFVMFVEFGLHFFCLVPLAYLFGIVLGWGVHRRVDGRLRLHPAPV